MLLLADMSTSPSKDQGAADTPEGNIYASKSELLEWVNGLLQLQLSKLEQFASGAVFCQLLDAYFQDVIPMNKVTSLPPYISRLRWYEHLGTGKHAQWYHPCTAQDGTQTLRLCPHTPQQHVMWCLSWLLE